MRTDQKHENRIAEILSDKGYSREQANLMQDYAEHLRKANYTTRAKYEHVLHLQKYYKLIKKDISRSSEEERKNALKQAGAEVKKSMKDFFQWYSGETELRDFKRIIKDKRELYIDRLLNWKDYKTKTEYSPNQKKLLQRYYLSLKRRDLRLESIRAYLQKLKTLMLDMGKPLDEVTKIDIDKYLDCIAKKNKPKTVREKRLFLLYFFEWLRGKKKEEIDLIRDIKISKDNTTKLPEDMLKPEDIQRMVQVADNFRDKALIILLYETGARKGEFLQLRIKHIKFNKDTVEYASIKIPQGKTVSRNVPIIYSIPHLQNWLNCHPRRDDPEAPLFITMGSYLGRPLGEDAIKLIVKKTGKRAGIKKKIYPHLFRHSRMTELGDHLQERELNIFAGWSKMSRMASVYVHKSEKDVQNKILVNAGVMDKADVPTVEVLKNVRCPRCEALNSSEVKYCRCGFCLDLKEVNKLLDERKKEFEQVDMFSKVVNTLSNIQQEIAELKARG